MSLAFALSLAVTTIAARRAAPPADPASATTKSAREALGVWGGWGAFRDPQPRRCFAVAVPAHTGARAQGRPFASIASWPGRARREVVFVRLSAPRDEATPVTLSVGERRFRLSGRGDGVWSPDPATDRAIVAALRGERSMSVEAVAVGGQPFADSYLLAGAATAVDAATLGCLSDGAR